MVFQFVIMKKGLTSTHREQRDNFMTSLSAILILASFNQFVMRAYSGSGPGS